MRNWMVAALITVGLPVAAQEVSCVDAQSQADMTACAEQDWQAQDEALNEAYGHAMRAMKALDAALPKAEQGAATALKQAQRAWITYRDAACLAEGYTMHGGSAEPMVVYGCMSRLTEERTNGLYLLTDEGG